LLLYFAKEMDDTWRGQEGETREQLDYFATGKTEEVMGIGAACESRLAFPSLSRSRSVTSVFAGPRLEAGLGSECVVRPMTGYVEVI